MFVFWVLQTACFALYSETGNVTAAHAFIAMICEWLFQLAKDNFRLTWRVAGVVLFYAFCE